MRISLRNKEMVEAYLKNNNSSSLITRCQQISIVIKLDARYDIGVGDIVV